MSELYERSARSLAAAIREREVSSAEVVDACLRRIERVNPALNAVVRLRAGEARRVAEEADADLARGEIHGPLHGVPMTIKDSLDTEGMVTTWGTPGRARHVPPEDATAVARLRAAGAILLGKTNTPELTLGFETHNPIYGRTRNPYDLERTPGGSSGGAAAIVAAGGSPLDLGSDTGGSIRVPAHFCGVAGIRPTSGRVPRTGHAVGPGGLLDRLTQIGPIARFVEDLALALPIISGPDSRDPAIVPMPLADPEALNPVGLRVAVHADNGIRPADAEVADVVNAAGKALAEAGAIVDEARPPGIEETQDLFARLLVADGGAWVRLQLERSGTPLEETSLRWLADASALAHDDLARLLERWEAFQARMLAFLEDFDLIVCPPNAKAALAHETSGNHIDGFSYTMTYNLTGWPGAVVRAGTSSEGLPIGVQLIARPWREDVALACAARIEASMGGWRASAL